MPTNAPLSKALIDRMERMGNIGHWRWDVNDNKVFWSEGVYHIHGLDFNDYLPNLDATLDAYLPEDRGDVEACLTHAIENQENFTFEKRIKRPDGEIRYVVSHGECEIDEDGNLVALFGIFQDITPIKKQEELYELAALGSNSALWDWDVKDDKLRWAGRSLACSS